jgi:hypothetical protein
MLGQLLEKLDGVSWQSTFYCGIILSEDIGGTGSKIAKALKVKFNGFWDAIGKFVFTDPLTKSTFTAMNEKEAREKLGVMRMRFGY